MLGGEQIKGNLTVVDLNLDKSRHRNLECRYCQKMGHIKADCFKLKNKLKQKENFVEKTT